MNALRTVSLVILSLTFYAIYNFWQLGALLFPIPANDFVLFIIGFYLYLTEKNFGKDRVLLLLLMTIILLKNPYNYTLFLDNRSLMSLDDIAYFDWLDILFILLLTTELARLFIKNRALKISWLLICSICCFVSGLFLDDIGFNGLRLLAYVLIVLFFVFQFTLKTPNSSEKQSFFLAIWLLLTFLELTLFISLYLI